MSLHGVSVQYNGRFLLGIILFTQCYHSYHRGTRLDAMTRFCLCKNLRRDRKIVRREPGRDGKILSDTGRMVMMRSIGYK